MRIYRLILALAVLTGAFVAESPVIAQPVDQPFHKLRIMDSVDAPLLSVF
jgi:hypothetical protein